MAEIANLKVSALLSKVEKIPDNLGWMIMAYVENPDSLFSITRRIVKENEEICYRFRALLFSVERSLFRSLFFHEWGYGEDYAGRE